MELHANGGQPLPPQPLPQQHQEVSRRELCGRCVRRRLFCILAVSATLLAVSASLLEDDWLLSASRFLTFAFYECQPLEARNGTAPCPDFHASVHDNMRVLLAVTMVTSLVGAVLNGAILVTVCRDQHEKNLHDAWVAFTYLSMTLCVLTLFLLPIAFFLWTTVRTMREYRDAADTGIVDRVHS